LPSSTALSAKRNNYATRQVQQEYDDQLGIYVQEKAEQIDRLQSNLAAALTSEKAQAASHSTKSAWAGQPAKKRAFNGNSKLRATNNADRSDNAARG
jgi:hypothetical protein